MGFRLPPGPVDAHLHKVLEKVPKGAGALLAARLSPVVEALLDAVLESALEGLKKENDCRKAQGLYLLKNPRLEHFIGSLDSLAPILEKLPPMLAKPYGTVDVLWCGGDSKGEEGVPDEPGIEANPPEGQE